LIFLSGKVALNVSSLSIAPVYCSTNNLAVLTATTHDGMGNNLVHSNDCETNISLNVITLLDW
jgi:hypothetical protein